jgi:hypothetical protein
MITEIKYLGRKIEVEYFKQVEPNGYLGSCNNLKMKINLLEHKNKEEREATLLHELLHIISGDFELELNEKQICALANTLYSVIKENKELIDSI